MSAWVQSSAKGCNPLRQGVQTVAPEPSLTVIEPSENHQAAAAAAREVPDALVSLTPAQRDSFFAIESRLGTRLVWDDGPTLIALVEICQDYAPDEVLEALREIRKQPRMRPFPSNLRAELVRMFGDPVADRLRDAANAAARALAPPPAVDMLTCHRCGQVFDEMIHRSKHRAACKGEATG